MLKKNEIPNVIKTTADTATDDITKQSNIKKSVIIICTLVLIAALSVIGFTVFTYNNDNQINEEKNKLEDVLSYLQSGEYDKAVEIVNNDISKNPGRTDEYSAAMQTFLEEAYTTLNESECKMSEAQKIVESYQAAEQKNEIVSKMNLNESVQTKQKDLTNLINSRKAYFDAMRGAAGDIDGMVQKLDEVIPEDRIYENVQHIKVHLPAGTKALDLINKGMKDYANRHRYYAEAIPYYMDFVETSKKIEVGMVQDNSEFIDNALEEMSKVRHTFYKVNWDENRTLVINTLLKDYNAITEISGMGIDISGMSGVFLNTQNVFNPILQRENGSGTYLRLLTSTDIDEDKISDITIFSGNENFQLFNNASGQDISSALYLKADEYIEFMVSGILKNDDIKIEVSYTDKNPTTHKISELYAEAICNTYILSNLLKYDSTLLDQIL